MKHFNFILELTKRDLKEQFAGSILGSFWAVLWPFIDLFIYIIIFGKMMGGRLPGASNIASYGVYLAVGLIPWKCFSTTIIRSASIFIDKKHIITKVNVSLVSLLFFVNLAETIKFLISCALLSVFFVATDHPLNQKILLLPLLFYLQQAFALALGLTGAVLTVFIRDVREIVGVVIQFWFWFTPIVYIVEILPDTIQKLIKFNPVFTLIDAYHKIFVFNQYPCFKSFIILALIVHALLLFAFWLLKVFEKEIRDFL